MSKTFLQLDEDFVSFELFLSHSELTFERLTETLSHIFTLDTTIQRDIEDELVLIEERKRFTGNSDAAVPLQLQ